MRKFAEILQKYFFKFSGILKNCDEKLLKWSDPREIAKKYSCGNLK